MAMNNGRSGFFSRLVASKRSPEIPEAADVYGWLCGSWDLDVLCYRGVNVAGRDLRERSMRPGCSKDAPCRMCGSCRAAMTGVPIRIGQ